MNKIKVRISISILEDGEP